MTQAVQPVSILDRADGATGGGALCGVPEGGKTPPQEAIRAFLLSLSGGDLKRASGYLTRDACFVTPDRTTIYGRSEIRGALAQLASSAVGIEVVSSMVLMAGEVAVASERWGFRVDDPRGEPYMREANSTVVLRRFDEGWKLAIVAPWR